MSHPPPDWSEEELLLLRSAEEDRPPSGSLAATLAAVGVGAAAGAATSAAAAASAATSTGATSAGASATAAKWGGAVALSKWVSVVAISGAVATGVVYQQHARQEARTGAPSVARAKPARATAAAPSAAAASDQIASPQPAPGPSAETLEATSPAIRPTRAASKRKAADAPAAQPDLSREIATIDEARSALRRGSASAALAALDRYDAELAQSGSLRHEAAALRIEALFRLHDRTRAESLANAFLVEHPSSPYATRIRELVATDSATERR